MKLEVKNICKSFDGKKILKNISFTVESGRAMGFLGRNGAGKTTTIRVIMDVFKPDSGEILINGKPFVRENYKVGYLPEDKGMYQKITLFDQLVYFGQLKGMNLKDAKEKTHELIMNMGLSEYELKPLEKLSKGNQQKINIAQAVINDPDILILDEPFGGLDPVNAQVLKDIIRDFIKRDKLVIFSSHQMSHVEEFCNDVTFIKNGEIILSDNLKQLKREMGNNKFKLKVNKISNKDLDNVLSKIKDINYYLETDFFVIECLNDKKSNKLLSELIKLNLDIELFGYYEPSLESIFINLERDK